MYLFINENHIEPYDGKILKRFSGNKLVKVISNPTEAQLKEFGYKELIKSDPIEEKEGYYIDTFYQNGDKITQSYRYIEAPKSEDLD